MNCFLAHGIQPGMHHHQSQMLATHSGHDWMLRTRQRLHQLLLCANLTAQPSILPISVLKMTQIHLTAEPLHDSGPSARPTVCLHQHILLL